MAYQSFDGEQGDSNSSAKLEAIKLPADLTGKAILDIGCNEGFFVREALRRGASRAVGVDMSADLIAKAKQRVPGGEFHAMSWWDVGGSKYDYILFLSAIHYEKDQRRLLTKLSYSLNPGGTLILECGFLMGDTSKRWTLVNRHDGVFRFPTYGYLEETLLEAYSTRVIGNSVQQSGDPLKRYVLHCTPIKPRIFVISGWSHSGKTTFCQMLGRKDIRVVNSDVVMTSAIEQLQGSKDPFVAYLCENLKHGNIDLFAKKMVDDGRTDQFCRFIMRFISSDDNLTVVEGFPFIFPELLDRFKKIAEDDGYMFAATRLEGGIESKL